jgi:hypothetical protein
MTMPLTPPAIAQAIVAAGPDLKGVLFPRLATFVGVAVAAWAQVPANLALQGVTVGAVGSGAVAGKVYVVPAPLPVPAQVLEVLFGVQAPAVGRAVGLGIAAAVNATATYQGVSVGVGSGTDVSKVSLANGPALVLALSASAATTGLVGVDVARLCAGLGPGIADLLLTGSGVGVVAGPVGPSPGAGTSTSRVS